MWITAVTDTGRAVCGACHPCCVRRVRDQRVALTASDHFPRNSRRTRILEWILIVAAFSTTLTDRIADTSANEADKSPVYPPGPSSGY